MLVKLLHELFSCCQLLNAMIAIISIIHHISLDEYTMYEVTAVEIKVMENLSEDEDGTMKEDGNEAVLCSMFIFK